MVFVEIILKSNSASLEKISISDLTSNEIIALSVYRVAGETGTADSEDVAVEADKIAKGKFRWKKYRKYIDIFQIRGLLANAKISNLIKGGEKKGWSLTKSGIILVNKVFSNLKHKTQKFNRQSKSSKDKFNYEYSRIINSSAYKKYNNEDLEQISKNEAKMIFRIDDYLDDVSKKNNISKMIKMFSLNKEMENFLRKMKEVIK